MNRVVAGFVFGVALALPAAHGQIASPAPVAASPNQPEARDSALEAHTSAVAAQLRCPVCQGLSIQDSPSELAQQMRSLVRDQIAAGRSPDEVKAYFVSKYGEWILLAPKPHGFNILVYAVPVLVIVGGAIAITLAVRRWTAVAGETPSD